MSPLTSIGEMSFSEAHEGGRDYFFKPSFAAMNAIGTPAEIVSIFSLIHGANVQEALNRIVLVKVSLPPHMINAIFQRLSDEILAAAMHIMQCCYTGDYDLTPLIGEWKGWKHCVVYRPGELSRGFIIAVAQTLMQHGVIGKAKVRRLQRNESNSYSQAFEVSDYIIAARNHFGMSRDDAASLTMTEFTLLLSAKYPEQKGLTKDEYDAVAEAHLARQAARRAKSKQR
ncbi:DUF6246 family protein [Scandinavium sp. M-37]|uniref:DUF6246 family protein n=1 Tax=Scandinavium sp. M-37 TaxID=3373077 RepID=UPI0037473A87